MTRRRPAQSRLVSWLAASMLVVAAYRQALGADTSPTWEADVRPILKAHCTHCHGEEQPVEGGVDLRLRRFLDHEAEGYGALLVPGDPSAGELLRVIRSGEMPKGGKKVSAEYLSADEQDVQPRRAFCISGRCSAGARRRIPKEKESVIL
jgi:hypothetical protein